MKLYYCAGDNGVTNFGDELNHTLWTKYLPGAFDDDQSVQFVGIGTLLNDRLPKASRTVVFGAGVGYYGPPRPDKSWAVYAVRGPLSADALGLSPTAAVTDPGMLVARLVKSDSRSGSQPAFMPHWQSEPDEWRRICQVLEINFIDPRWPPARVLQSLLGAEVLLTEAMHGAIVADALRVPWIPIRTRRAIHSFKWQDWSASMELPYRAHWVPPAGPITSESGLLRRTNRLYEKVIAHRLFHLLKNARRMLSKETVLAARLDELEERLGQLRKAELIVNARP